MSDKSEDARKRWMECVGMPTTEAASQKIEADSKAAEKEGLRQFEALTKELGLENMAAQAGTGSGADGLNPASNLFPMLMSQEPEYKEAPVIGGGSLSDVEFRTPEEKARALRAVNAELESLPVKLPKKEDAPDQTAILKLAASYNASSRKNFRPDELSAYTGAVTFNPSFDS
ncbi:MAG: hypothetical protein GX654_15675 [Desulfatiglans sp.]|nr:hypothetical protein [Desulfatiglans sp.]